MAETLAIFGISLVLAIYGGYKCWKADKNQFEAVEDANRALNVRIANVEDKMVLIANKSDNAYGEVEQVHEHLAQIRKNQMWLHNKIAPKKKVVAPKVIPPKPEVAEDNFKKVKGQLKGLSK